MIEENHNNKEKKEELSPEILAFKEQFKKQSNASNDKSDPKNIRNINMLRLFPYFAVIIGFALGLYILVILFDNFIIPSMVHDREVISVPDIIGMNLDEAKKKLQSNSLTFEISAEQYSDALPPNTVIRQIPAPKIQVKEGRPIYITLSKGKETIIVPSLIGYDLRRAKLEIMKLGLNLGDISFAHSEIYPKDTIIAQSIKPGSKIEFGNAINLTISKGSEEMVVMPLLIGQSLEDIMFVLENYGLRLGNVSYEKSETYQSNVIIDQEPKEYESVQLGTYVNIKVSQ